MRQPELKNTSLSILHFCFLCTIFWIFNGEDRFAVAVEHRFSDAGAGRGNQVLHPAPQPPEEDASSWSWGSRNAKEMREGIPNHPAPQPPGLTRGESFSTLSDTASSGGSLESGPAESEYLLQMLNRLSGLKHYAQRINERAQAVPDTFNSTKKPNQTAPLTVEEESNLLVLHEMAAKMRSYYDISQEPNPPQQIRNNQYFKMYRKAVTRYQEHLQKHVVSPNSAQYLTLDLAIDNLTAVLKALQSPSSSSEVQEVQRRTGPMPCLAPQVPQPGPVKQLWERLKSSLRFNGNKVAPAAPASDKEFDSIR